MIREGGLAAFPTETVYGLGADAFNEDALAAVFEVKRRPRFDPLIIHIASLDTLDRLVDFSAMTAMARGRFDRLSAAFWPGPITFILPKLPAVPDLATAGLSTCAVRFPANSTACKLIRLSTGAVAAPSANPFGYVSPTSAAHVEALLGASIPVILDDGPAEIGLESTVLDLSAECPRVLRHGGIPIEDIRRVVPETAVLVETAGADTAPSSPGLLGRHYAPATPLVLYPPGGLEGIEKRPDEGYLYLEKTLRETAARLFATLRELDGQGLRVIHAELAPDEGLGRAVNDRLRRGAAHAIQLCGAKPVSIEKSQDAARYQ